MLRPCVPLSADFGRQDISPSINVASLHSSAYSVSLFDSTFLFDEVHEMQFLNTLPDGRKLRRVLIHLQTFFYFILNTPYEERRS